MVGITAIIISVAPSAEAGYLYPLQSFCVDSDSEEPIGLFRIIGVVEERERRRGQNLMI